MIVEIVLRNRNTNMVRKIKKKYAELNLANIAELLRKAETDEAIIQIFINADSML